VPPSEYDAEVGSVPGEEHMLQVNTYSKDTEEEVPFCIVQGPYHDGRDPSLKSRADVDVDEDNNELIDRKCETVRVSGVGSNYGSLL
jgi:hypothetical protein